VALAILMGPVAASAQLISVDGGLGVYDSTNNVTWVSDGNLFATQSAATGNPVAFVQTIINDSSGVIQTTNNGFPRIHTLSASDFNTTTGQMDWWGAQAWVNYLNTTSYGGSAQWALPTTVDADTSAGSPNGLPGSTNGIPNPPQSSSQMARLFYGQLGQQTGEPITSVHNGSFALFNNVQSGYYWSGTGDFGNPGDAWVYGTYGGDQGGYYNLASQPYALAVAPGEVNPVPLPASLWLILSALGGLGALVRRT
jgi:hypothetical protein